MTLPCERKNALKRTLDFLYALTNPKETPKVPRNVRKWARMCLRHYPHDSEIEQIAKKAPKLLGPWPENR